MLDIRTIFNLLKIPFEACYKCFHKLFSQTNVFTNGLKVVCPGCKVAVKIELICFFLDYDDQCHHNED